MFSTSYVSLHRRFYDWINPFSTLVLVIWNTCGHEQGCEIPPTALMPFLINLKYYPQKGILILELAVIVYHLPHHYFYIISGGIDTDEIGR